MKCVYYVHPKNAERVLRTGIDPSFPEDPAVATDERYIELFPMVLLELTKGWQNFAWRYDSLRIREWVPIVVDIPPATELAFRVWGSQELWTQELVSGYERNGQAFLNEYPSEDRYWHLLDSRSWKDIEHAVGWDFNYLTDEIPDFRIGSRIAALSVKRLPAQDLEQDLRTIADIWGPKLDSLGATDSERLVSHLGMLCVLKRGPIEMQLVRGSAEPPAAGDVDKPRT